MALDIEMNADNAKVLAMFVLSLGSFLFGILPGIINAERSRRFPLLRTILVCFGGGVLLCTSVVHILPDVREAVPEHAELIFCCGFFVSYIFDELIHYFIGRMHCTTLEVDVPNNSEAETPQTNRSYGTTNESAPLLGTSRENAPSFAQQNNYDDESNRENVITSTVGLLFSLTIHATLEGLAVGVQDEASKVLFLLGAVACHKYVISFCLGTKIRSNQSSLSKLVAAIFVFSVGSACGIGIGMIITDTVSQSYRTVVSVLQGLAGGTLLYVTVCEILPEEKKKRDQDPRRSVGLVQFLAVAIGFITMSIIDKFMGE